MTHLENKVYYDSQSLTYPPVSAGRERQVKIESPPSFLVGLMEPVVSADVGQAKEDGYD